MRNDIKKVTIVSMIVGISILGYGYMGYLSKREAREQKVESEEREKTEKAMEEGNKRQRYLTCKSFAEADYHAWWEKECEARGLGEGCSLPLVNANRMEDTLKNDIDNCFKSAYAK